MYILFFLLRTIYFNIYIKILKNLKEKLDTCNEKYGYLSLFILKFSKKYPI